MPKKRPARKTPAKKEPPPIRAEVIAAAESLLIDATQTYSRIEATLATSYNIDADGVAAAIAAARARLDAIIKYRSISQPN